MSAHDGGVQPVGGLLERVLTPVVTNPLARAVKARLRDAWWTVRGPAIRNPQLRRRPRSVLFVCQGNICRSPFATRLAAQWLAEAGWQDVQCLSAGFKVSHETTSPSQAVEAAHRFGVSLDAHRSTPLGSDLMQAADAVVVMEASHLRLLRREYPALRDRIHLLPLFAQEVTRPVGYLRYTISDPYGQATPVFDACYARIADATTGMIAAMFGGDSWRRA